MGWIPWEPLKFTELMCPRASSVRQLTSPKPRGDCSSSRKPLRFQEGLLDRVAAEEGPQRIDGVTAAALRQDLAAVTQTGARREDPLGLEAGHEHVRRVDLAPQIAVVLRVVAAGEMPEGGAHVRARRGRHRHEFFRELSQHLGGVGGRHRVDRLVEGCQHDLPHVLQARVCIPALQQRLKKVLGNRLAGLVVSRHAVQCRGLPNPILEHLGGCLDEVPLHTGAGEHRKLGLRAELVHDVAKLVEERLDVAVGQQTWLALGRLREVADSGGDRHLPLPSALASRLKAKACRVAILALAGVHVHVEESDKGTRRSIGNLEGLDILMPRSLRHGFIGLELEAKQLLVDVE
mmetsp:Transcript_45296/g.145192  ORF Transcript_45296/g.145192 Transcript_45296/m.145192 type:complete len:348 (+) Transcript_45296:132-1175(+)